MMASQETAVTMTWAPTYQLDQEQFIARPRSEVFGFFCDAFNLQRLTPPFLRFKILTPAPIEMKEGTLIDYALNLYGLPLRWRTRIEEFAPESHFVDVQIRGPYTLSHHTHTFESVDGGTMMRDVVRYQLPLGPLGQMARAVMVRRALEQIFSYRTQTVDDIFGHTEN